MRSRFSIPARTLRSVAGLSLLALGATLLLLRPLEPAVRVHAQAAPREIPRGESPEDAQRQSAGCMPCHTATDSVSMHAESAVVIGCADCHGGDPSVNASGAPGSEPWKEAERKAHVQPRFAEDLARGGHPVRIYTRWLRESPEFIRFVNPGDLRVAAQTCGSAGCHTSEVLNVHSSMMTHGAMLWEAALYNN